MPLRAFMTIDEIIVGFRKTENAHAAMGFFRTRKGMEEIRCSCTCMINICRQCLTFPFGGHKLRALLAPP